MLAWNVTVALESSGSTPIRILPEPLKQPSVTRVSACPLKLVTATGGSNITSFVEEKNTATPVTGIDSASSALTLIGSGSVSPTSPSMLWSLKTRMFFTSAGFVGTTVTENVTERLEASRTVTRIETAVATGPALHEIDASPLVFVNTLAGQNSTNTLELVTVSCRLG